MKIARRAVLLFSILALPSLVACGSDYSDLQPGGEVVEGLAPSNGLVSDDAKARIAAARAFWLQRSGGGRDASTDAPEPQAPPGIEPRQGSLDIEPAPPAPAAVAAQASHAVRDVADSASPAVMHAAHVFAEQPALRIVFNDGGGMGKQRASLAIVDRLEKLGFTGRYYIHSTAHATKRTSTLIGNYRRIHPSLTRARVVFETDNPRSRAAMPHVRYAISGADDQVDDHTAGKYNADWLVVLHPTDWGRARRFQIVGASRSDAFQFGPASASPDSISTMALACDCSAAPEDDDAVLDRSLPSGDQLSFLKRAVSAMKAGEIDLQLVYGLMRWPDSDPFANGIYAQTELARLIGAYDMLAVERSLPRPVVLLAVGELAQDEALGLRDRPFSWKYRSVILDPDTFPDIAALRRGDVKLVAMNRLPLPVFDMLLQRTSLPPVIEGANARGIVKETRTSGYMHGGRRCHDDDFTQAEAAAAYPQAHELFINAQVALSEERHDDPRLTKAVADFLRAHLTGSHDLNRYFALWYDLYRQRPDALLEAAAAFRPNGELDADAVTPVSPSLGSGGSFPAPTFFGWGMGSVVLVPEFSLGGGGGMFLGVGGGPSGDPRVLSLLIEILSRGGFSP